MFFKNKKTRKGRFFIFFFNVIFLSPIICLKTLFKKALNSITDTKD